MIVNIGTGVALVKIAFSSSRSATLIERKMLQNTILSIKTQSLYIERKKSQVFTFSNVLACVSIHCADQKQHPNRHFLTKSIENTLLTYDDISNEYLHEYNTGVKSQVFCSLHQSKCAVYTMFLITFVFSN